MGACGLPMVAPPVGVYFEREDMPGAVVAEPTVENFSTAIRSVLDCPGHPAAIRDYWYREFSIEVIRKQWETLVSEVECSGQS